MFAGTQKSKSSAATHGDTSASAGSSISAPGAGTQNDSHAKGDIDRPGGSMNHRPDGRSDRRASDRARRCAVSGETLPVQEMIRFVASPDGLATPDLAANLPGRGVWVTAQRDFVDRAVRKNAFSRSFKQTIKAPKDLANRIEAALALKVADRIGLARRAGATIAGTEKCRAHLNKLVAEAVKRPTGSLFVCVASDMAPGSARKFFGILDRLPAAIPVHRMDLLTADELGRPFGRESLTQILVRPGGFADGLVEASIWLSGFRPGRSIGPEFASAQDGKDE
jgi:predicted RNA-binding protein YlxR (DUF448 family)